MRIFGFRSAAATTAAAPSSIGRSKHKQDGSRSIFRICLIPSVRRQDRANGFTLAGSDLVQGERPGSTPHVRHGTVALDRSPPSPVTSAGTGLIVPPERTAKNE